MKSSITTEELVDYLNELIAIDKPAMAALMTNRVPCNEVLADHPTVQAGAKHGGFNVGMLGILNGMFETYDDGWGQIQAHYDEDGSLEKLSVVDPALRGKILEV